MSSQKSSLTVGIDVGGTFTDLLAIDSINRPGDHMTGRKLLTAGSAITETQAADGTVELKSLLPA